MSFAWLAANQFVPEGARQSTGRIVLKTICEKIGNTMQDTAGTTRSAAQGDSQKTASKWAECTRRAQKAGPDGY